MSCETRIVNICRKLESASNLITSGLGETAWDGRAERTHAKKTNLRVFSHVLQPDVVKHRQTTQRRPISSLQSVKNPMAKNQQRSQWLHNRHTPRTSNTINTIARMRSSSSSCKRRRLARLCSITHAQLLFQMTDRRNVPPRAPLLDVLFVFGCLWGRFVFLVLLFDV